MSDSKKTYDEIVSIILKHGKPYPKKHGNWYLMPYTNSAWIEMDSWNKRVTVFEGSISTDSEVLYWSGFSRDSKNKRCLGLDFGGFECVDDIKFYLDVMRKGLANSMHERKLEMQLCYVADKLDEKSRKILKGLVEFIELKEKP